METSQLEELVKKTIPDCPFGGVFASDTLPWEDRKFNGTCYIINLDESSGCGTHWISIILKDGGNEYFDSFGFPPPDNLKFEEFMNGDYVYNEKSLQHPLTTVCGQYCLFYVFQRFMGLSLEQIVDLFSEDYPLCNDVLLNGAVNKMYKTDNKVIDHNFINEVLNSTKQINMSRADCEKMLLYSE